MKTIIINCQVRFKIQLKAEMTSFVLTLFDVHFQQLHEPKDVFQFSNFP